MVDAAQTAVLESTVAQVGAAVGAMAMEQAQLPAVVAKKHQLFAQ